MSLARTDYPNIDERLYSTVLENGLRVLVVPRPGFLKKYAFSPPTTAARRVPSGWTAAGSRRPRAWRISWSTSSLTCPGAAR